MNRICHYFLDRKIIYIFNLSMLFIFYLILYLYHALIDAIVYATILCLVILVIYFCIDYFYYYQKTRTLETNLKSLNNFLLDLPQSSSLSEDYYQQIIKNISYNLNEIKQRQENQNQEIQDYFTLWVHQIKTPIFALRLLIQSQDTPSNDLLLQLLRIEQYDLKTIIQDIIKKQATFFIQKKLFLHIDDLDLNILTDAKWLSFVIEQIISNALKYTKNGGIHIYVSNETLYIKDTGIGIKEEDLPRIFEKGYTGYNGRQDKKASGLGLYLCARILKYLGHPIKITSKQGQGTTVMIDFHVYNLQVE